MKSLSDLPRDSRPQEEETLTSEETGGEGSLLLLALLLSRMDDKSEVINSLAPHVPGGEKLRLALKFGSELKRCGGGFSSLKVVSRYTKQDLGSVERALARSEQLKKTVELMRSGEAGRMQALAAMAGINPAVVSMLKNASSGGLSPEMLMAMMGRR
ncbi:MAG: hypothetical protein ACOYIR_01575 [Christensenellales bacterium]|jgi:hypothetical protein